LDPYFFVHELEPGALEGLQGRVVYLPPFDAV
jgi:predicted N-acetyltransferase YhbS